MSTTCNKSRAGSQAGFTLIELMVAMIISIIVLTLLSLSVNIGLKDVRVYKASSRVHANAVNVVDAISYYVKQAKFISLTNSTTLVLTMPDDTTETITLAGNFITANGQNLTTSDVKITALAFTKLARSVQIAATIKNSSGIVETMQIQTTLSQRDPFN